MPGPPATATMDRIRAPSGHDARPPAGAERIAAHATPARCDAAAAGAPRVFVVDDDEFTRAALERVIRTTGFEVRTFRSARDFLDHGWHRTPGCLVLDMCLPDLDGLEVQARLLADGSFMPIIFLTGFGDVGTAVRAMKAGAVDFLRKPVAVAALLASIGAALAAEARVRKERADREDARRRFERLTPREQEVFHGVVAGLLNKQIARELGVTEKTVKFHRARVMEKMGVRRLAQLVQQAGLLDEAAPSDAGDGGTPIPADMPISAGDRLPLNPYLREP